MKLDLGNYLLKTDDRNFILYKKVVVKEHRLAKAENVGKENLEIVGYFSNFENAMNYLTNRAFIDNGYIEDVKIQIENYKEIVKGLAKELNINV